MVHSDEITESRPNALRLCTVCGGDKRELLFRQQFAGFAGAQMLRGYDVVVCTDCGFGFADGIPDQATFDAYYREMSKYEYQHRDGKESEEDVARFHAIAGLVQRFCQSFQARILDVGCATGLLLSVLKQRGFNNVSGIDPSPVCAETAKRLYGIHVSTNTLSDTLITGRQFDFVVLVSVLEHIRDLGTSLAQIRDLLSPGALVYVEVPDATQFASWQDAPFQQFSVEHINFFSPASLSNLMRANGFVQVQCYQDTRQQTYGTVAPVVAAIFQKSGVHPSPPTKDTQTQRGLTEYIQQSQTVDNHIQRLIEDVVTIGKPIIVWGTGTHTLRLLETSSLSKANICAFVDSNPRYEGKQLNGIPVVAPHVLKGRSEPILISSRVFQREIERQIRDDLHLPNELILLYEV